MRSLSDRSAACSTRHRVLVRDLMVCGSAMTTDSSTASRRADRSSIPHESFRPPRCFAMRASSEDSRPRHAPSRLAAWREIHAALDIDADACSGRLEGVVRVERCASCRVHVEKRMPRRGSTSDPSTSRKKKKKNISPTMISRSGSWVAQRSVKRRVGPPRAAIWRRSVLD